MRRPVLAAAGTLAAFTALALLGVGWAIRPPGLPAAAGATNDATTIAVVSAFYAAANTAIGSGDPSSLTPLLGPGFRERDVATPETTPVEPDRDRLIARLLAIHAIAPGARLAVDAVAADGNLVIAQVRVRAAEGATFLGLRLDDHRIAWGLVDTFRVAEGLIVEHRGSAEPAALLTRTHAIPLQVRPEPQALRIVSAVLAPGARYAAGTGSGTRAVAIERGSVVVEVPAGADSPVTLAAGDRMVLSANTGFAARNEGGVPVALLDLALLQPRHYADPAEPPPAPQRDVAMDLVADDLMMPVTGESQILAIGRATLGPGERLGWARAAGPVLVRVESGAVALAVTGAMPWISTDFAVRSSGSGSGTLEAGAGALLKAGATDVVAAPDAAATVLIVTLIPAVAPP